MRIVMASLAAAIILAGTEAVVAYPRPSAMASLFFRSALVAYLPIVLAIAALLQRVSPARGLNLWLPLLAGALRVATVGADPHFGIALAVLVGGLLLAGQLEHAERTPPFLFGVTVGIVLPILTARLAAVRFASDPAMREQALVAGACVGVSAFLVLRALVARWPRVAPVFLLGPVVSLVVWSREGGPRALEPVRAAEAQGVRPDIALIVLDTVRAVPVQGVGDLSTTMPRLDAFAQTATRFTNVWSNGSWTLPAHASLFSGLRVSHHRYDSGYATAERSPSRLFLAPRLRAVGYATAAVAANFGVFGREDPLLDGFERVHAEPLRPFAFRPWLFGLIAAIPRAPWMASAVRAFPGPSVRAPAIVDQALAEWTRPESRPRFLFVNLMEAHLPWIPDAQDQGRFGSPGLTTERDQVAALGTYLRGARPTPQQVTTLQRRYAEALYSLDRSVERLLQGLVAGAGGRGLVLVVTSDHGESLGENDRFGHRNSLDEPATRVPLIVRSPAMPPGVNDAPVELADVFRLIADAAGVPVEAGLDAEVVGQRREVVLEHRPGPQGDLPSSYPRGDLSALVVWPYKYQEGPGAPPALFNLAADPAEAAKLVGQDPEMAAFFQGRLRALSAAASGSKPSRDAASEERLRALGYVR